MTVPLIILATFSAFAGFLNPGFHMIKKGPPMEHWLAPLFESITEGAVRIRQGGELLEWPLAAGGISAFTLRSGSFFAWWVSTSASRAPREASRGGAAEVSTSSSSDK